MGEDLAARYIIFCLVGLVVDDLYWKGDQYFLTAYDAGKELESSMC